VIARRGHAQGAIKKKMHGQTRKKKGGSEGNVGKTTTHPGRLQLDVKRPVPFQEGKEETTARIKKMSHATTKEGTKKIPSKTGKRGKPTGPEKRGEWTKQLNFRLRGRWQERAKDEKVGKTQDRVSSQRATVYARTLEKRLAQKPQQGMRNPSNDKRKTIPGG